MNVRVKTLPKSQIYFSKQKSKMYQNKKISVCLPCKNEGEHLKLVLAKIPSFVDEIIVVSNNSSDNTYEVAQGFDVKLGVKVFQDDRTLNHNGEGFAYQTAIRNATGDIIICADADCTYPTDKIGEMLEYMINKNLDFMSGSRYPKQKESAISPMQQFGVAVLNLEILCLYGLKINDSLSGMWLFKREIIPELKVLTDQWIGDWNHSPQIKLNAFCNSNLKCEEYPIVQYERAGSTHQHYFKTGFGHLVWIALNRFGITMSHKMDVIPDPVDLHHTSRSLPEYSNEANFTVRQKHAISMRIDQD